MTDRALIRISKAFRDGLLGEDSPNLMCAAVCWPLAGLLSAYGVKAEWEELAFGDGGPPGVTNHIYLRLADGRILDPTADQFGLPAVYLGPVPQIYLDWQVPAPSAPPEGAMGERG